MTKYTSIEKTKEYMYLLHQEAKEILESLKDSDKKIVERYFEKNLKENGEKEHYWSCKKLFALAGYIPVFLQIGLSAVDNKVFDGLIYIDTHAGAGLAKIGPSIDEVFLGSPLISITWPKIIGERIPVFKKITKGFDKHYFIEKDIQNFKVLKSIVSSIGTENIILKQGDANNKLKEINKEIKKEYEKPLILLFVDPYGSFETQLNPNTYEIILSGNRVDLIHSIMSPSIIRGLNAIKDHERKKEAIKKLWGNLCGEKNNGRLKLCRCYNSPRMCTDLKENDVLQLYKAFFKKYGYKKMTAFIVSFKKRHQYHILLALKTQGKWIDEYVKWYNEKMNIDYETLRQICLTATGKGKILDDYLPKK